MFGGGAPWFKKPKTHTETQENIKAVDVNPQTNYNLYEERITAQEPLVSKEVYLLYIKLIHDRKDLPPYSEAPGSLSEGLISFIYYLQVLEVYLVSPLRYSKLRAFVYNSVEHVRIAVSCMNLCS